MKVEYNKGSLWKRVGDLPRGSVVTLDYGSAPWIIGETYHNEEHRCTYVRAICLTDGTTDGFDVDSDVILVDAKVVIG